MGFRRDGIRSLADLMARCRVDDVTGCWVWAGGCSDTGAPITRISAGVLKEAHFVVHPRRAGWLLAGRKLAPSHVVMRVASCRNELCVNPAHAKAGTRGDCIREAVKRGSYAKPARITHLTKSRLKQAISPEAVKAAEKALNDGATIREVSALVGIDPTTALRIRAGTHIHQTQAMLPGASAFTWRP